MSSKCWLKCSVKSVSSVREKIPASLAIVLFLTDNTEEQNTQMPTETLSQPITQNITTKRGLTPSPSPNGEGSDH